MPGSSPGTSRRPRSRSPWRTPRRPRRPRRPHRRPPRRRGDPGRPGRRRRDRRGPRDAPEHGRVRAGPGPAGARLRGHRSAARLRRPDAAAGQLQPGRHREVRAGPELPGGHADLDGAGRAEQPGRRLGHRRDLQERRRGDLGRLHVEERRQERRLRAGRRGRLRAHDPGPDLRHHHRSRASSARPRRRTSPASCGTARCRCRSSRPRPRRCRPPWGSRRCRPA